MNYFGFGFGLACHWPWKNVAVITKQSSMTLLYSQPIKLVSNSNHAFGFGLASRKYSVAPFFLQFLMWIVVLAEVSSFFCLFDGFLFGFFRFSSKEWWLECHLSVKWSVDTAGCHLVTLLSGQPMMAWRINKHSGVYKKGAPFHYRSVTLQRSLFLCNQ